MLKFLGLKPGMRVIDLFGGNHYWAEITAPAVGPEGPRDDLGADAILSTRRRCDKFAAFQAKQPNVSLIVSPFEAPDAAGTTPTTS